VPLIPGVVGTPTPFIPHERRREAKPMSTDDALLELLRAELDDAEFTRCCTGSCDSNDTNTTQTDF
jgi:hypothetical protein